MGNYLEAIALTAGEKLATFILLDLARIPAENQAQVVTEYVKLRRRIGLYVNMAVITPLLTQTAEEIILRDENNILIGKIKEADNLPQLIDDHLEKINFNKQGTLWAKFPDDSELFLPVPLLDIQVDLKNPTSIEY